MIGNAGGTAGTAAGACLLAFPSPLASLACMGVGVVYIAVGFLQRQLWLLLVGLGGLGGALVYHVHSAIEVYQWSGWAGSAGLGVCVIIAGSLVERFHAHFDRQ